MKNLCLKIVTVGKQKRKEYTAYGTLLMNNEARSVRKFGECQKFCVSPLTNCATTASAIALTQKNLHNRNLCKSDHRSRYDNMAIAFTQKIYTPLEPMKKSL